jgi:hypothetical protein
MSMTAHALRAIAKGEHPNPTSPGTHTTCTMQDGIATVTYRGTKVVALTPAGEYQFNPGGWVTATTLRRMNTYAPAGLHLSRTDGAIHATTSCGTSPVSTGGVFTYTPAEVNA